MYALFVVEVFFRLAVGLLHPLTPEYYESRPPGAVGNLPMLVVFATLLLLSLRQSAPQRSEALARPAPT